MHLICNSHIDPVWLWQREEGVGAALSTFRSAVSLCGEFDYIFCHNEAFLYEQVEKYDPETFDSIKRLIKAGKWRVMGGWYLQPDCLMPDGETFVRLIQYGKRYFREKFGVEPEIAMNLDSFGHSKGLVQILCKSGYKGYLICRPHHGHFPHSSDYFVWEGLAGCSIPVARDRFHYCSEPGKAADKVNDALKYMDEAGLDTAVCLWGVGNHGGGPSRKDLQNIAELQKSGAAEIVHSTPERLFGEIKPESVYSKSLVTCFPGCYFSMTEIKRLYCELENMLYKTEKMAAAAAFYGLAEYPRDSFASAEKDLMLISFHDILPGTCIEEGFTSAVKTLGHGYEILKQVQDDVFFTAAKNEKKAADGEFPILVYNPHPYKIKTAVDCEFLLPAFNYDENNVYGIKVYDRAGNELPVQTEKESGNLNVEWRKRAIFDCELEPSSLNRFSLFTKLKPKDLYAAPARENGLKYGFYVYDDNEDTYGSLPADNCAVGRNPKKIEQAAEYIIENGPVRTVIEKKFKINGSSIIVNEKRYAGYGYIDLDIRIIWNDSDKTLKIHFDKPFPGTVKGQIPFGTDEFDCDGGEKAVQRFVTAENGGKCFAVINNGVYGFSANGAELGFTLLRSSCYAALTITNRDGSLRPIVKGDRFIPRIECGERRFQFRAGVFDKNEVAAAAQLFNQPPYVLCYFPGGKSAPQNPRGPVLDNPNITLVTFKGAAVKNKFYIRLHNNTGAEQKCGVRIGKLHNAAVFLPYEVKTLTVTKTKIEETAGLESY